MNQEEKAFIIRAYDKAELVRTYKIIEDAEVLMHPVLEEIGVCPCCV